MAKKNLPPGIYRCNIYTMSGCSLAHFVIGGFSTVKLRPIFVFV
ncbi:MAG: hypothetical protein OEM06_14290 [Desulfobacteraceae bacterium]|nr:hypothetical protein [Desulfobacteraceae bacterium]MDH3574143.1 hypothetical protein [Desulfobacteraceae bacterium]MDH3721653.1 hypothetical protein [Desulfobacteraceae bacterium]MDH3836501.1 hypothetical protein [Desulfobacteraceae bacterium]